jgi:putative lipoic acid-binding regulatory protein
MADQSFSSDSTDILQFPCDFPVKVLGKAGIEFEGAVVSIIRKHFPQLSEGAIQIKPSKKGNYISLTATLHANSKAQLDALYQELVNCEAVLMAL